ncbi:hypothetical protein BV898_17566 [Hypsibius exemplaris]|uniref:Carboxypeptidase regulatory-like domain-containing protein n=1 Tax=Hypsibius exemplaris TaxID=2072580 RepID=A0A9X6RM69_HYPEX|nr:hypothetical protein BV898_17566 [Hypsibius exemplaris]
MYTGIPFAVVIALAGFAVRGAELQLGSIAGAVKDAVSSSSLGDVEVRLRLWPSSQRNKSIKATKIFLGASRMKTLDDWVYAYTMADSRGSYSIRVPLIEASATYNVEFSAPNYNLTTISNVRVGVNDVTIVEELNYIDRRVLGPGIVSGLVRNAQTGNPEGGVLCQVRKGSGIPIGQVVREFTSARDGTWSASLETGNYAAECSKLGFATITRSGILAIGLQTIINQHIVITPLPRIGETRIILRWSANPRDLDSHLTGPIPGSGRFHVFVNSRGSNTSSPYALLDVDTASGYGPETLTITRQAIGLYRFSVLDNTNRGEQHSEWLSNSGATVTLIHAGVTRVFSVPQRRVGTLWTVFELDGRKIIPINSMINHCDSATVP